MTLLGWQFICWLYLRICAEPYILKISCFRRLVVCVLLILWDIRKGMYRTYPVHVNSSIPKSVERVTKVNRIGLGLAWHSMDRSTFNRHIDIPTIYHQLKQTQNPRLSSLSSTAGTHPTNIRNATTSRKPTTGTFPTTTNINAQSTNDNKPVNHQPIRHSERLESQRRMSELDIKTPRNPRTSDEDSKHRSRKLKIINSKSREQNNLIIYIYIYMLFFYLVWRCPMTIRLLLGRLMKFRSFTFAPFLLVNHHGMLFNYLYSGGSLFITCSLFIFINITNLLLTVF